MDESKARMPEIAFLTLDKAAAYLGISPNTLYVWRHRRKGRPASRWADA